MKNQVYTAGVAVAEPRPQLFEGCSAVTTVSSAVRRRIWIDLDNSPHVPFFAPIIEELERSGYSVLLTARDCFQVCGLADLHRLQYRRIGRHYGKRRMMKLAGLVWRSVQLIPSVLRDRPVLAISHGSRSQLVAATLLRVPSMTIADYEFAKLWMLMKPTWVMTPEAIDDAALPINRRQLLKYPGIKEDVYVANFRPEPGILSRLGINESDVVVLVRPPATEAHYHCSESDDLFEGVLEFLADHSDVRMILLPRNQRQAEEIRCKWAGLFATEQIIIPDSVVDGVNLIWHADVMISGGGTMNREAAALGVPVYSIFRGRIGAVDRYLASLGRLTLLESMDEIPAKIKLEKRQRSSGVPNSSNKTLETIVRQIRTVVECPDQCK